MVVAGSDAAAVGFQEVAAAEVETVATTRVGNGHFNALVGFERNVLHGVSIHVGIASTRCFTHTVGNVALGHLLPRSGGEALCREGMVEIPLVFFARSLAHGVVGCGVLKACENLVAHEHSAAGVTYDGRRAACGLGIYVVNHRDDVVHINVFALEFHLGAEIVATIAEHGAPNDLDVGTLIIIGIVGYEGFAIEVLSTANGRCGTREVLHLYALKGHSRSGNGLACAETYGEGLGACLKVHGLTASEVEGVAHLHETSLKHIIAQSVEVVGLRQIGFADSRLLLRIEHCIGISSLVGLAGKVNDGDGHSLVDIVDRNGRKLAFGHYKLKVVLRQFALGGVGVAVLVVLTIDSHGEAFGEMHRIGAGLDDNLVERPAATSIFGTTVLPEAEGVCAIQRIGTDALIPVEVLVARATRSHGLNLEVRARVVVDDEVRALNLVVGHLDEVLLVAVTSGGREAHPFASLVTVDVVGVGFARHFVEREQTVVLFGLRRRSQRIDIVTTTTYHCVQMVGAALTGLNRRRLYLR